MIIKTSLIFNIIFIVFIILLLHSHLKLKNKYRETFTRFIVQSFIGSNDFPKERMKKAFISGKDEEVLTFYVNKLTKDN